MTRDFTTDEQAIIANAPPHVALMLRRFDTALEAVRAAVGSAMRAAETLGEAEGAGEERRLAKRTMARLASNLDGQTSELAATRDEVHTQGGQIDVQTDRVDVLIATMDRLQRALDAHCKLFEVQKNGDEHVQADHRQKP